MNNALKKELSLLLGIGAAWGLRSKPGWKTGLLAATSLGLLASSWKKKFELRDQCVYITGGSRGLGLSLAWNLLKQGAQVTLVARDQEELEKGQGILLRDFPGGRVFLSRCDVTKKEELRDSLSVSLRHMGNIDLVINNAGAILVGPFTSMEREDFEAQLKLHLFAVLESTQIILPYFKSRGGGRIVNICSLGGKVAVPHMLPYDVSKFALAGLSQGLAAELKADNIHLTTVYPTVMRTGSPVQAVFKGDHEKEFAWFGTLDNLPLFSMSADVAAKKILSAVEEGQTEVVLSVPGKARVLAGALFPETMNALMALAARLLPAGDSTWRKTGAESSALAKKIPPLRKQMLKEEQRYNQEARHDADFNLGLH